MKKHLLALLGVLALAASSAHAQQGVTQFSSPRNLLDNGGFAVQTRGTGINTCATTSALAVTAVAPDRWVCDTNVGSGAGRSVALTASLPTGATGGVKIYRTSGALTQPVAIMQQIDTGMATAAAGKSVVLSFSAEALAGLAADNGNVITATIIGGTGTLDGFGSWTASPAITPAWTGITTLQTTTFTITTSWAKYIAIPVNVPSTVTELGVIFSFTPTATGAGTTDGFAVSNAQLEIGSVASPFEAHPYLFDVQVAQKYLYNITEGAATFARAACQTATSSITYCYLQFPQLMVKAPTMTYVSPGFGVVNASVIVACTTIKTAALPTGNVPTPLGVMVECDSSAGFSAASTAAILYDDATATPGQITAWSGL